ncbi:hypothetical protein NDU88_001668, partial [Pleurodeles waltl]
MRRRRARCHTPLPLSLGDPTDTGHRLETRGGGMLHRNGEEAYCGAGSRDS